MKNLVFIALILFVCGCKKKIIVENEEITNYSWPLKSATINPAMNVDGKSTTNYMTMAGASGCLNNNYTLSFSKDGSYAFSSNGPLCDMISYVNSKWTKSGNDIILTDSVISRTQKYYLSGNTITNEYSFNQNGIDYTVRYTFIAKKK